MNTASLLVNVEDRMATMTLSRPGRGNAITFQLLRALEETLRELESDRTVRVIVIRGEGEGFFSSGFDLDELAAKEVLLEAGDPRPPIQEVFPIDHALGVLAECSKPTVAMVNGDAIGTGLELVLCCDFALSSETATFRMPPASIGILYSPAGLGRFLRHIGFARTKELFLTAKGMAASRAKEIGIVQELFPYAELPNAVRNLAQGLAENSPSVLASTKKVLDHLTRLTLTTDAVVEVNQLRVENRQSHDLKEGLRAALAKRKPEFP